jgi:hypothetical protein
MKFKSITTFFTFFVTFFSLSQTEILNETFELGIPSTWKILKQDNFTINPEVSNYSEAWISVINPDDETDTIASSSSYFTSPARAERWLISPQIELGEYGNYISWSAKSFDPSYPETYKVLISKTDDSTHHFTDTLLFVIDENYEWTDYEFNLSELGYNSETIYIAFVLNTFDGFKFGLDDVKSWINDPVSVLSLEKNELTVFPNPFQDKINIPDFHKLEKVIIKDLNGKEIYSQKIKKQDLDLSFLDEGIYFLEMYFLDSTISTQKIVKN